MRECGPAGRMFLRVESRRSAPAFLFARTQRNEDHGPQMGSIPREPPLQAEELGDCTAERAREWRPGNCACKDAPGAAARGVCSLMKVQQQGLGLQPQLLLQPQPQPLPPQLPLPQQHQMMISRMMIQQQLPPPKPLLHIPEPPMKS